MDGLARRVLSLPREERIGLYRRLSDAERVALDGFLGAIADNPFLKFEHDPEGFVTQALGETLWSKQREILSSLMTYKRTAVPACHAPGKSHLAARAVAWWVSCHPPGTAKVITTSTTYRQVRNILWPHIRRVAARHRLPGEVLTTEWKLADGDIAAYGFSAVANNEAAVQGEHAPNLLIVVDEAGGVPGSVGRALEALMTGGHTRLLLLGNPPTDEEGSWFEKCCRSALYNTIPIPAHETPNFTGEDAGSCKSCPISVSPHSVGTHLIDQDWVDEVTYEFGEDSAFVEARVHAQFPAVAGDKVIPLSWAEQATENDDPLPGSEIKLGVDVASDGGDEFVVAWLRGWTARISHKSSGAANANAVDVAGVLLEEVKSAEGVHRRDGIVTPVRVKIDALGVGWGVVSLLQRWGAEGRHSSEIVGVKVSERATRGGRFANRRAELWWTGRELLQPEPDTGRQQLRLDVDRLTLAQLATPKYRTDTSGRIQIEKKTEVKARGGWSPDRAEAVLLALYEPGAVLPTVAPVSLTQANPWDPRR